MAIVVLNHSDSCGPGLFGEMLTAQGHRLHMLALHDGDPLPTTLEDVDAVVTCGGGACARDAELPWREGELDFLRRVHEAERPLLGICLGSQLLALALGGQVTPLDSGPEIGWHEVSLTPAGRDDPLYRGIGWTSMQAHWHGDQVSELPPGGRCLASSQRTANQAWAIGLWTYGIQYHPEIRADTLLRWADEEPDDLRRAGIDSAELREQIAAEFPAAERLARRFFESLALCLMPVDRRYAGVAKDLHH